MSIHLIMPMGGNGSRFSDRGFPLPKPMISISGHPFFYWATESIRKFTMLRSLTFVVLREHVERFHIDTIIRRYYPSALLHILDHVLDGAVLTCLEGVKKVDDATPVVFNDCDHIFSCKEFYSFCNDEQFDTTAGALLTFVSTDPKFSFIELDKEGRIVRTVEKEVVSNQAICGAYFFRSRDAFVDAAKIYLNECIYKEFFISGVYNVMTRQGAGLRNFLVDWHLPFGTPEEYDIAIQSDLFGELL